MMQRYSIKIVVFELGVDEIYATSEPSVTQYLCAIRYAIQESVSMQEKVGYFRRMPLF